MQAQRWFSRVGSHLRTSALLTLVASSSLGEIVIVESRIPAGDPAPCPPYCEQNGNWANSTAKSSAPGCAPAGSRFATNDDASFSVSPLLVSSSGLYYVAVTHGDSPLIPTNLLVSMTVSGGSGLSAVTEGLQQAMGLNQWYSLGYLQLEGTNRPTITFTRLSGDPGRFYADAVRFVGLCPPVPMLPVVNGPLVAGQTHVDVPGVLASAQNVSVYADGVKIGERTSGIVEGLNCVTTTTLVKGWALTATQTAGGCMSCPPPTGQLVGGGPNPRIRLSLIIRDSNPTNHTIGADGGTNSGCLVFLKATGWTSGYGSSPAGGTVVLPDSHWQTVIFDRATDSSFCWNGDIGPLTNDFAVVDGLAFAMDDLADSGPFEVYLDNFANGTTVIQGFENATNGEPEVIVNRPSSSGMTSLYLLAPPPGTFGPDLSVVVNTNADSGTNCLLLSWQFKDGGPGNWLRALFRGSRAPNPIVDLRQTVSLPLLLLPVGKTLDPGNLQIRVDGQGLVLNWSGISQLQCATNAAGPYEDLPGVTTGPFNSGVAASQTRFFRLRK